MVFTMKTMSDITIYLPTTKMIHSGVMHPTDIENVRRRHQHFNGFCNPNTLASIALFILLIISYLMVPFVASSSSTSIPPNSNYSDVDEEGYNTTNSFITHMSRSQLGYNMARVPEPTALFEQQNEYIEQDEYNTDKTSSYQKIER